MRLFIAAPLPAVWSTRLCDALAAQDLTSWAPTDPDGWHLTVRFIGERAADELDTIHAVLQAVCATSLPYALHDAFLCTMPEDRPRMIWSRFAPHPAHGELHHRLSHALGLTPDDREPFWPHVTLARAAVPHPSAVTARPLPGELVVDRLALYESRRTAEGLRYTPLLTLALSGTAPAAPAAGG